MAKIVIEKLITIDGSGMPKAPDIRQLQDRDVLMAYSRDTSKDKIKYLKEMGVVYYLGDPKSPVRQRGLSDDECLKEAIINYNLPKDYVPDVVVKRIIDKYIAENLTEAGVALDVLRRSIHLTAVAGTKMNDYMSKRLSEALADEDITPMLSTMDAINKRIVEVPALTKALGIAYENLRNEEEEVIARGGVIVRSSMDADEDD